MPYTGKQEQKSNLQKALRDLVDQGLTQRHIAEVITNKQLEYIKGGHIYREIKRSLIDKYMHLKPNNKGILGFRYEFAKIIYDVIEVHDEFKNNYVNSTGIILADGQDAKVFYSIVQHYQMDSFCRYSDLGFLCQVYAMYRPIWTSKTRGKFVRSIVTIDKVAGLCRITDRQCYFDPFHELGYTVNEEDRGYLVIFGKKIFSLTKDVSNNCMKFLVIDQISTMNVSQSVEWFYGNLIAVSHTEISPGCPFICKRIDDNDMVSRIVDVRELDDSVRNFFKLHAPEDNT